MGVVVGRHGVVDMVRVRCCSEPFFLLCDIFLSVNFPFYRIFFEGEEVWDKSWAWLWLRDVLRWFVREGMGGRGLSSGPSPW